MKRKITKTTVEELSPWDYLRGAIRELEAAAQDAETALNYEHLEDWDQAELLASTKRAVRLAGVLHRRVKEVLT